MANFVDIKLPDLGGRKSQVEPNDLPPDHHLYIQDAIKEKSGMWKKREGIEILHPDRGNQYDYITPFTVRGLLSGEVHDGEARGEWYYNSHKRKTIAKIKKDGVTYVFAACVQVNRKADSYTQRLLIMRGILQDDNVTINWVDSTGVKRPIYHTTVAQVNENYDGDNAYIEYSMVVNPADDKLYLLIVLRDTTGVELFPVNHSVLRFVSIDNIYADTWNVNDAEQTWSIIASPQELALANPDHLTHDVDLELDSAGDLHLVYGFFDSGELEATRYDVYSRKYGTDGNPLLANVVLTNPGVNVQGVVIKNKLGDDLIITVLQTGILNAIKQIIFDKDVLPSYNAGTNVTTDMLVGGFASDAYLFGAILQIDSDGTPVYGYMQDSPGKIRINVDGSETWLTYSLYIPPELNFGLVFRNWDIIVKDGLVIGYFHVKVDEVGDGDLESLGIIRPPYNHVIYRKVLIFDDTDADYVDGEFLDAELVEQDERQYTHITAFQHYEANNSKLFSFISRVGPDALYSSYFDFILQDRGLFNSASDVVQKSIDAYSVKKLDGFEDIEILQCEVPEGIDAEDDSVITRYRFYERRKGGLGDWQWHFLPGQMSEMNRVIIQETTVTGRANFWTLFNEIRAGCGIEEGNTPIVYRYFDRMAYRADIERIIGRRFRLTTPEPPVVGDIVQITPFYATVHSNRVDQEVVYPDVSLIEKFYQYGNEDDEDFTINFLWFFEEEFVTAASYNLVLVDGLVTHKYKKFGDFSHVIDALREFFLREWVQDPNNQDEMLNIEDISNRACRHTDLFLGFAYRLDNGQITQITPQEQDGAYYLGVNDSTIVWNANENRLEVIVNPLLQFDFTLQRWDYPNGSDPRITDILVFAKEKTFEGETKFDVPENYKLWIEFSVARQVSDQFKDEIHNGNAEWTINEDDPSLVNLTGYGDYRNWKRTHEVAEGANLFLGTGVPLLKRADGTEVKSYLDGYKHAVAVNERPFYGSIRINGEKHENHLIWASTLISGGSEFNAFDIVDPANFKPFNYKIRNIKKYGDGNIVMIGDVDSSSGHFDRDTLQWVIEEEDADNERNYGTLAEYSVIALPRKDIRDGIFFLADSDPDDLKSLIGGVRYNMLNNLELTDDVLQDNVIGLTVDGLKTETTFQGIQSLMDSDAMCIYIKSQGLLLIHFPNDNVTFVRNFFAERINNKFGPIWTNWIFGKNPKSWANAPAGHMVFTNEEFAYRYPPMADTGLDAGVAIDTFGIIPKIKTPDYNSVYPEVLGLSYICAGTPLLITLYRDDGDKNNVAYSIAAATYKTKKEKDIQIVKKIDREFAVRWESTVPASCTALELHNLYLRLSLYQER